jgi:hypothetical protein
MMPKAIRFGDHVAHVAPYDGPLAVGDLSPPDAGSYRHIISTLR